jgi:hypothetical protein
MPTPIRPGWRNFQAKYGQNPIQFLFAPSPVLNLRTEQTKKGVILIEN